MDFKSLHFNAKVPIGTSGAASKICTFHSKHRHTSLTCLTRSRKCADVSKFPFLTSRADIEQLSVSGLASASASGVKSAPATEISVQAECLSEKQRKLPLAKSSSYPLASSARREKFKGKECKSSALPGNEMDLLKGPAAAG